MTVRCRWMAATCLILAPWSLASAAEPRTDCFGDPLPDGVVARMGTVRFRHGGRLEFVGFLPDGKTIVSFGKDDTTRWWDAASGKELHRWTAPAVLGCAAASPDRRVLAAQVGDDVVLWDAASGKELWKIQRPDARLGGIAFSPDRKLTATCGERIWVWNAITGEPVRQMDAYGRGLYDSVAFLPDGKTLVATGREGTLRWWDVATGQAISEVDAHKGGGYLVTVSPDGKRLATAGADHALRLWDADKKTEICSIPAAPVEQQADCLAFSPDGKLLAAGGGDGVIRLYAAADGDELRRCEGHQDWVGALAFSANGATLVSGGADGAVRQWDVATGKEIAPFAGPQGQVAAVAVSPDGKTVASAGVDRRVHLWNAATGEERRSLAGCDGEGIAVLGFSPDGATVTSLSRGSRGSAVHVWTTADGKIVSSFFPAAKGYPNAFALSPDAAVVAACGDPAALALFDPIKGEIIRECPEEGRGFLQPGPFLGGGKTLAAFHHAGGPFSKIDGLLLWDVGGGGRELLPLRGDLGGGVCDCAAAPDGKILAVAGADGSMRLWNATTGDLIRGWSAGKDFILATAFSADGRTVATADMDGAVSLWETASGLRRGLLKGGQGFIDALAFSPDGRRLYTGGHDGTVLAWDLTAQRAAGLVPADPTDLDDKALDRLWDELGSGDAGRAYRAVWTLAASPARSAPFLKARLLHPAPTAAQVARWIADLDSDDFEVRERASAELRWFDEVTETALTAALAARPSAEARRRIEELLEWVQKARVGVHPPEARVVRAVEALEDAGTPQAREVLAGLADGPEMSLTREAKAALERLRRRSPEK